MKSARSVKTVLICLLMTACTQMCSKVHKDMNAEEVVEAYLEMAFNITSLDQKDDLMEWTTGNLQAALAGANDETFQEAYIDRKYKLSRFSLMERRDRTPRETEITFQLTYLDLPAGSTSMKDAAEVMTENTVAVIREKGYWKIREVIGNKTTFDFPLSKDSIITASPEAP